ncbi:putative HNH enonculease [Fadolivirus algeromassiliense]|jgi:hypothetical protein|uniref:HNH enonculease n=1 Tax=Fadolivirus FV1/VV64 TaxID=3070911 RepID=A0A7D3QV96_9VIRU|nr:putative HNH enonculease [Fadolivirus algeromassiliense]QKF94703.1 putative HNH enonculease [Fadolivirus FV1/VV64]
MEIKLGGKIGGVALISEIDYEIISKYKWSQDNRGYVFGSVNSHRIYLHRFIMKAGEGVLIDHINNNKLDNRRENLRFATKKENNMNKKKTIKSITTSKYRGVSFKKRDNHYHSRIMINGKEISLGYYKTDIEAAEAFDMYIVKNNIQFVNLNFPDKKDEYNKREYIPYKKGNKQINYVGVKRNGNNWQAEICYNGKNIYLLTSSDPSECAKRYDKYIIENNIPNKKLNFPDDYPDYKPVRFIQTKCEQIDENTIKLLISSNHCPKIDKDDYDKIKYFKCSMKPDGYVRMRDNNKEYALHRYLLGITDPNVYVDHINNDRTDNRKSNLRISNNKKNVQNKIKKNNTTSQYIGVTYNKQYGKWHSSISKDHKYQYRSYHDLEIDAARKRDLYILTKLPDDHYKLNFEWTPEDITYWKIKLNFD